MAQIEIADVTSESFFMKKSYQNSQVYLVGGGLASLAAAAFFIKDGKLSGQNIHIFEQSSFLGGCLDSFGSPQSGYLMRGYRMLEDKIYSATCYLFSFIPSLVRPRQTVRDEIKKFNRRVHVHSQCRLVREGKIIDAYKLGLNWPERSEIFALMACPEHVLEKRRIKDYFSPGFFKTDFWLEFCTTFSFKPNHSLIELKRYFLRFIEEPPKISTLSGVRSTPYNQYDSLVRPLVEWLKKQGVNFKLNCEVTNLSFKPNKNKQAVRSLHCLSAGKQNTIKVDEHDYVLLTLGSMGAGARFGSYNSAPQRETKRRDGSWSLWEKIAKRRLGFGRPQVFTTQLNDSSLESFTFTFRDPTFLKLMEKFTGNPAGEQGLVTFINSHWLMTVVLPKQPHFIGQPKNVNVGWGYCLYPYKTGNFVAKKMNKCTGREIMIELCSHLGFKNLPQILRSATCTPCLLPYGASEFLPRKEGDRPLVVPKGSTNLAFIGQFCEIPDDIVFTLEYSVRSAQIAVYSLLGLTKKVTPIYKGQYNIKILYEAFKAALR